MYYLSREPQQKDSAHKLDLYKNTVSECYFEFKNVCAWLIEENPHELGGLDLFGEPILVELNSLTLSQKV